METQCQISEVHLNHRKDGKDWSVQIPSVVPKPPWQPRFLSVTNMFLLTAATIPHTKTVHPFPHLTGVSQYFPWPFYLLSPYQKENTPILAVAG